MIPTRSITILGCLWASLLMVPVTFPACSTSDDGAAIRKLVGQAAELAEKQQIGDLVRLGTDDLLATPGNHDANSIKRILFAAFRRYGQFTVLYPKPSVEIDPDGARASATVYFVILSKDRTLPGLRDLYNDPLQWLEEVRDKADPYLLQLTLVKQDRRWLVRQAHLEGAMRRIMGGDGIETLAPTALLTTTAVNER